MKFGKEPNEVKRSKGVYTHIIEKSLIDAGYSQDQITRADFEAVLGGGMRKGILKNLLDAELVIADISGGNANVFYELGIRHALKKRGTIIIKEKTETIPFDLGDNYIHSYIYDIDELEPVCKDLTDLINLRKTTIIDSPIFDMQILTDDINGTINNIELQNLQNENTELRLEIEKLQNYDTKQQVHKILNFSKADESLALYGQRIRNDLMKYRSDGDVENFKKTLERVNERNEFIDDDDFVEIARLCGNMRLYPHKIMILEYAHQKFPLNDRIFFYLMDSYIDSPSKEYHDLAKKMITDYYKIEIDKNKLPIFSDKSCEIIGCSSVDKLSTVFNLYFTLTEVKEALSIIESAEKKLSPAPDPIFIKRNKAFVFRLLERHHEAIEIFEELVQDNPSDSELRLIADSFVRIGQPKLAYQFYELRTIIDYDNADSYIFLANGIERCQIVRTKDGFISTRPNIRIAKRSIVPLLLKSLKLSPYEETVWDVKSELVDVSAKDELQALNENAHSYDSWLESYREERFDLYDWSVLEFIENNSDNNKNIDIKSRVREILENKDI